MPEDIRQPVIRYIQGDCSAGRFLILKESAFSGLLGKE